MDECPQRACITHLCDGCSSRAIIHICDMTLICVSCSVYWKSVWWQSVWWMHVANVCGGCTSHIWMSACMKHKWGSCHTCGWVPATRTHHTPLQTHPILTEHTQAQPFVCTVRGSIHFTRANSSWVDACCYHCCKRTVSWPNSYMREHVQLCMYSSWMNTLHERKEFVGEYMLLPLLQTHRVSIRRPCECLMYTRMYVRFVGECTSRENIVREWKHVGTTGVNTCDTHHLHQCDQTRAALFDSDSYSRQLLYYFTTSTLLMCCSTATHTLKNHFTTLSLILE